MEKFVHRANLEHLKRLLVETKDDLQRRQIEKLIAEEEAKYPPK
jgi:hypothetical protein